MLSGRFLKRSFATLKPCNNEIRNLASLQKSAIFRPNSALSRCLCDSKPEKSYEESTHNVPKYQLQAIDKFFLVATGTMKRGEIPDEVSYAVVEKAQNRRRILVNILTILLTIGGSAYAISRGKRARDFKTEDNLFERNIKRYKEKAD